MELEVETIRVSDPVLGSTPYQGTTMIREFEVSRQTERRSVPAGAVWVPANQPDFEVAVQLFEPEAPDSMLRWGLLNTVFERKEYIGSQHLAELADEMLSDDSRPFGVGDRSPGRGFCLGRPGSIPVVVPPDSLLGRGGGVVARIQGHGASDPAGDRWTVNRLSGG